MTISALWSARIQQTELSEAPSGSCSLYLTLSLLLPPLEGCTSPFKFVTGGHSFTPQGPLVNHQSADVGAGDRALWEMFQSAPLVDKWSWILPGTLCPVVYNSPLFHPLMTGSVRRQEVYKSYAEPAAKMQKVGSGVSRERGETSRSTFVQAAPHLLTYILTVSVKS